MNEKQLSMFDKPSLTKLAEHIVLIQQVNITCPNCGKQLYRARVNGRLMYICEDYPKCDTKYGHHPTGELHENCGGMICRIETKEGQTARYICSTCLKYVTSPFAMTNDEKSIFLAKAKREYEEWKKNSYLSIKKKGERNE